MDNVASALLSLLRECGCHSVFTLSGGPLLPFMVELEAREELDFVACLSEAVAGSMADGFARSSGNLGCFAVTSGPAVTNSLTALAGAKLDFVPLLLISAQVKTSAFGRMAFQEGTSEAIDVVATSRPSTKISLELTTDQPLQMAAAAISSALQVPRGPVHLSIPSDVFSQGIAAADVTEALASIRETMSFVQRSGEEALIRRATQLILGAERPAILAGYGVVCARAYASLQKIAELREIPVATTPKGKGAFPEMHRLSLGVFGFPGAREACDYLFDPEIDLLLVLGSRLGEWSTRGWDPRLFERRESIRIDVSGENLLRNHEPTIAICADIDQALRQLIEKLESDERYFEASLQGCKAGAHSLRGTVEVRPSVQACGSREEGLIGPEDVVEILRDEWDESTRLYVDIGNSTCYVMPTKLPSTGGVFCNLGFGSMGWAGPAAVGGRIAAGASVSSIALMGDGAFAMSCSAIHSSVQEEAGTLWIVLNDGGYGMLAGVENVSLGNVLRNSRFDTRLDVVSIARGFGARALTVNTCESLRQVLRSKENSETLVVEIPVDQEVYPADLEHRAEMLETSAC